MLNPTTRHQRIHERLDSSQGSVPSEVLLPALRKAKQTEGVWVEPGDDRKAAHARLLSRGDVNEPPGPPARHRPPAPSPGLTESLFLAEFLGGNSDF